MRFIIFLFLFCFFLISNLFSQTNNKELSQIFKDAFLGDIMSVKLVEVKDIILDDKYWSNIISVFDRDFKFMNDTLIKK